MYRPSNGNMTVFENFYKSLLSKNDFFSGDLNINVLDSESNNKVQHFLSSMFQ